MVTVSSITRRYRYTLNIIKIGQKIDFISKNPFNKEKVRSTGSCWRVCRNIGKNCAKLQLSIGWENMQAGQQNGFFWPKNKSDTITVDI